MDNKEQVLTPQEIHDLIDAMPWEDAADIGAHWHESVRIIERAVIAKLGQPAASDADPTDPGHDVAVMREQVRHLERRIRQLSAPAAQPEKQAGHIANEWADMATNGIQWLRNIRDGISTPAEALAEMESNLARIRSLQAAPAAESAEPDACPGCAPGIVCKKPTCGRLVQPTAATADAHDKFKHEAADPEDQAIYDSMAANYHKEDAQGDERAALGVYEVLDQLANGTRLDEVPNHDDDSLRSIASFLSHGWAHKRLLAHAERVDDAISALSRQPSATASAGDEGALLDFVAKTCTVWDGEKHVSASRANIRAALAAAKPETGND